MVASTRPAPWPECRAGELTIYGRIFAVQDVSAGAYADTVTVVIDF
jgi:spore coat protein U-like protein